MISKFFVDAGERVTRTSVSTSTGPADKGPIDNGKRVVFQLQSPSHLENYVSVFLTPDEARELAEELLYHAHRLTRL